MSYTGVQEFLGRFAEAIVHSHKKWAALLEALLEGRWLASLSSREYLTTVATTIYHTEVRPDVPGKDVLGVEHRDGPGGRIKRSDALRIADLDYDKVLLEEIHNTERCSGRTPVHADLSCYPDGRRR